MRFDKQCRIGITGLENLKIGIFEDDSELNLDFLRKFSRLKVLSGLEDFRTSPDLDLIGVSHRFVTQSSPEILSFVRSEEIPVIWFQQDQMRRTVETLNDLLDHHYLISSIEQSYEGTIVHLVPSGEEIGDPGAFLLGMEVGQALPSEGQELVLRREVSAIKNAESALALRLQGALAVVARSGGQISRSEADISETAALKAKIASLQRKFDALDRKYQSLSNSKLGRLTLKIWAIRKRRREANQG